MGNTHAPREGNPHKMIRLLRASCPAMMTPVAQLIGVQSAASSASASADQRALLTTNKSAHGRPSYRGACNRQLVTMLAPKAALVAAVMPRLDRCRSGAAC